MVRGRSEDRGQPAPPPSVAVEGHRLSFVLLEALDFDFEGEPSRARSCARAGGRVATGGSAFGSCAL
ncbi:MAG: hypothetical protein AUH69_13220 [Actinobacteria bacterium 13_1_40CM_4_65_12]|nr:MAG: hypothetical protein AUH69_13220 [Actinobacteria bacterium 13_1_40CM_4_65_12]